MGGRKSLAGNTTSMDLDSDYCSNESESPFQNGSRTPTPPSKIVGKHNTSVQSATSTTTTVTVAEKDDGSVTFLVGTAKARITMQDGQSLMGKSAVLDKQINDCAVRQIEIVDWDDSKAFKVFLEYLQADGFKAEEPDISKYVADLIRLCFEYEVPNLLGGFIPLAKQTMTLENCVDLYVLGAMKDIEDLRAAANGFILRMGNSFLEHANFLNLDCISLSLLIANDEFPILELTLFRRLKDWVNEQCKRLGYPLGRKELFGRVAGQLFRHVRYSQMTPKEFRQEVVPSGLLSLEDIEGIKLRHKTHQGYWHMLPPYNFVDRPRMAKLQFAVPLYNNVQIGFRKIAGTSNTIQESVRFMVSHDIYLTGIGFFGPARGDRCANGSTPLTAYSIRINLEGDYSKYHLRLPTQHATVITRENFAVELSHPVYIQKLEPHKLTVWIDGEVTQFGVFPLPQAIVLVQNKDTSVITFHFGDADFDPIPKLEGSGQPSSSAPVFNQLCAPKVSHSGYKQDPRTSGVIRCISFVIKD